MECFSDPIDKDKTAAQFYIDSESSDDNFQIAN